MKTFHLFAKNMIIQMVLIKKGKNYVLNKCANFNLVF